MPLIGAPVISHRRFHLPREFALPSQTRSSIWSCLAEPIHCCCTSFFNSGCPFFLRGILSLFRGCLSERWGVDRIRGNRRPWKGKALNWSSNTFELLLKLSGDFRNINFGLYLFFWKIKPPAQPVSCEVKPTCFKNGMVDRLVDFCSPT